MRLPARTDGAREDALGVALQTSLRTHLRDGFGALLRAEREAQGTTIADLASDARITDWWLIHYERGTRLPRADIVTVPCLLLTRDEALADELNNRFLDLLGGLVLPTVHRKSRQKQIASLRASGLTVEEATALHPSQLAAYRRTLANYRRRAREEQNGLRRRLGYPALPD